MHFTDEILKKIKKNKDKNYKYAGYFFRMSKDIGENMSYMSEKYVKRSNRLKDCMDLWAWDKYELNKLLDLRKVNRCNNNRVCPNCRKMELAKFIHKFNVPFKDLLSKGYNPYLVTLSMPNCSADDLKITIEFLYKCFKRLYRGFGESVLSQNSFKFRDMSWGAALKVLEITYNKYTDTYHPHLHCIVFSDDDYCQDLFEKNIPGLYSTKRQCIDYHSLMDLELRQIWTMICKKIRLTDKNYSNMSTKFKDLYVADIREMDEKGVYEVLKYTFKDTDIKNYTVFRTIISSLENKRIRQGYGLLYNFICEDVNCGEIQDLQEYLEIEEDPQALLTKGISQLMVEYKDYKKISRYTPNEYNKIIE